MFSIVFPKIVTGQFSPLFEQFLGLGSCFVTRMWLMLKTNKTQIICAQYLGISILMQDLTLHPLFLLATTISPHSFVHVQKRGAREPPKNFSRPPERFIHSHIYSFFHSAKIQINKKFRFIEITKKKWFMILFLNCFWVSFQMCVP